MANDVTLRVRIRAPNMQQLRECLRAHDIDFSCCGAADERDGSVAIEALVTADKLPVLRGGQCRVEVVEDASAKGRRRQAEISQTNRFAAPGTAVPHGLGRKE